MILGLDVSTSCTGWCILEDTGALVEMGYFPLSKIKSHFKKAEQVKKCLANLHINYEINQVFIEENLQAFRPGLSSAKTLSSLAKFNGIVSYISFQEFCFEPVFLNVNSSRKQLGIKIIRKKNGGKPTKEQVLDWVSIQISDTNHQWPIKILKGGPRKGDQVLEPSCYDMADAYVIAKAGILNNVG